MADGLSHHSCRCNLFIVTIELQNSSEADNTPATTPRLIVMRVGSLDVGVFEDEVHSINEWSEPTPLPFSPDAVRGIVSIEGRMFTVLEISSLLQSGSDLARKLIVAFGGDEQLALGVDSIDGPLELRIDDLCRSNATRHQSFAEHFNEMECRFKFST